MNIIDLSLYPEISGCAFRLQHVHEHLRLAGHESYQLGPYTTNDVVDALREELEEVKKDYACLARELDGHDATECLMNLRQLKVDKKKYQQEAWNLRDRLIS